MVLISASHVTLLITINWVAALSIPQSGHSVITTLTPSNLSSSELGLISTANSSVNAPDTAPILNLTVPDVESVPDAVNVRCSYGHELESDDCLDALNTFVYPPYRNLTIAARKVGFPFYDLDLPIRWISGKPQSDL